MRIAASILFATVALLSGCATSPGVTLPTLPAWQHVDAAPISGAAVLAEAQVRYPGVPVHIADSVYTRVSRAWLAAYCDWEWSAAKAAGITYTPESFDCDDFSLGFYFFATRAAAKAGERAAPLIARLVVQWDATGRHELCGVVTDEGLFIVEPQPDAGPFRITPLEKFAHPILAITFGDYNP